MQIHHNLQRGIRDLKQVRECHVHAVEGIVSQRGELKNRYADAHQEISSQAHRNPLSARILKVCFQIHSVKAFSPL